MAKNFGFGGNIGNLMKQAQEMQKKIAAVQENLKNIEVSATVGGGAVSVKGNCDYEVKEINISNDLFSDPEMLKDLLVSAFNEYANMVKDRSEEEMKSATGNIKIPGF
ncbi:YbaB/EbfC family nucleoid-associated protein [Athalassotoga saccharophila]|uniref:YbaB/EbfC family nucleoid-associated protein n=1 Tax=Athalassotoga saccharophila TaxID=1441386 RepID=UPI00137A6186|nr:YbaB/EbfC family nucleoid-associated protein [Athalassotoga saccharophila]BBJ27910.1 nucleoid-associated protein [Athalassotoga saccharophila]